MKVLVAGLVGGVALFIWGALSHMVLPLGEVGVKMIDNEDAVIELLGRSMTEPGFYLFPGNGAQGSAPERNAFMEKYRRGPVGAIVFRPGPAGDPMPPTRLLMELLDNILAALAAAWVVARVPGARWSRIGVVVMMGVFAWLTVEAPYWNWYSFPANFTLAALLDGVVAGFLVGFVVTWFVKPPAARLA